MGYYGGGKGEPGSIQAAYDAEQEMKRRVTERAVRNSPPPLDDVGDDVSFMLDEEVQKYVQLPGGYKEAREDFDAMTAREQASAVYANPPNPKQRYGDKKVALGVVPPALMLYGALAFKEGARKYGAFNWRTTKVEAVTYIAAAMRHIFAYMDGQDEDEETGHPHIAHAIACLGILADATENGQLIDNRPLPGPAAKIIAERTSEG